MLNVSSKVWEELNTVRFTVNHHVLQIFKNKIMKVHHIYNSLTLKKAELNKVE